MKKRDRTATPRTPSTDAASPATSAVQASLLFDSQNLVLDLFYRRRRPAHVPGEFLGVFEPNRRRRRRSNLRRWKPFTARSASLLMRTVCPRWRRHRREDARQNTRPEPAGSRGAPSGLRGRHRGRDRTPWSRSITPLSTADPSRRGRGGGCPTSAPTSRPVTATSTDRSGCHNFARHGEGASRGGAEGVLEISACA